MSIFVKFLFLGANQDYTDYDCFLMAILSHGEQGIIYAYDAPYKPEDKLWGRFTGDKCITLAGKPKLFFIQACQGDRLDGGVLLRTQVDGSQSFRIPVYADFLIAYSTIPGMFFIFDHYYELNRKVNLKLK